MLIVTVSTRSFSGFVQITPETGANATNKKSRARAPSRSARLVELPSISPLFQRRRAAEHRRVDLLVEPDLLKVHRRPAVKPRKCPGMRQADAVHFAIVRVVDHDGHAANRRGRHT